MCLAWSIHIPAEAQHELQDLAAVPFLCQPSAIHLSGRGLLGGSRGLSNVCSRLVWGFSIVRSFAEIIQHPVGSFGGAQLCKLRGQNE